MPISHTDILVNVARVKIFLQPDWQSVCVCKKIFYSFSLNQNSLVEIFHLLLFSIYSRTLLIFVLSSISTLVKLSSSMLLFVWNTRAGGHSHHPGASLKNSWRLKQSFPGIQAYPGQWNKQPTTLCGLQVNLYCIKKKIIKTHKIYRFCYKIVKFATNSAIGWGLVCL